MARSSGISVENNFVKGRISESTGLSFPENAVTDEVNCVFNRDGSVTRRLGIDFESDFVKSTPTSLLGVKSSFVWRTASNVGRNQFVVVQNGQYIDFYNIGSGSLSGSKKSFNIDLSSYKSNASITDQEVRETKAEFSSGNGYLFIAHPKCEPLYIAYNSDSDTLSTSPVEIKIRDVYGIDDELEPDERPTVLSEKHKYNLFNQGWSGIALTQFGYQNPLISWGNQRPDFPSNSDVWWQFKDSTGRFNREFTDAYELGNTPAAKGHYLFNAFFIDRNTVDTGISTLPTESSLDLRPSCTAFYAGRVWWSGVNTGEYSTRVYYSQVIQSIRDFGKCYQTNDPTSELLFDLLPTDGGIIVIPDVVEVIKMVVIRDSLLIFASNGVWSVSGTDGGFRADDYKVSKINDVGIESPYSIVSIEGIPIWWNQEGIFTIQSNEVSSGFQVVNITNQTIKTFYDDEISNESKIYAQGIYNRNDRVVRWLYRSQAASTFEDNFKYDRVLNFDIDTQAFYTWNIDISSCPIASVVSFQGVGTSSENIDVTVEGSTVTVSSTNVFVEELIPQVLSSVDKYLTIEDSDLTFSESYKTSLLDWESSLGGSKDYSSNFLSGYRLRGESMRDFQTHYMEITSKSDSDNSFFVSGFWDYSVNSSTNRVTTRQQGYLHKPNRTYTNRRLRIRGNGPVLQFKIESQTGKPFNISGWATYESVENAP
jgi:hypothetical protein